jgi:FkbM family methyltransferase
MSAGRALLACCIEEDEFALFLRQNHPPNPWGHEHLFSLFFRKLSWGLGQRGRSFVFKRSALGNILRILPSEWKQRLAIHLGVPSIRWSLMQIKRFGFNPNQVMDVGAFRGDWAKICTQVFPGAQITCVEPQNEVQSNLRQLAFTNPNIHIIKILLGKELKENVPFNEIGPGSSVLLSESSGEGQGMVTIDHLIDGGFCKPPELLKMDVQGYETTILEGYKKYFNSCQVIQCEISLLPLIPLTPLIHETIAYLYGRDFVMFDLDEIIRAPSDGSTWQIDAIFCRVSSFLRKQRLWVKEGKNFS